MSISALAVTAAAVPVARADAGSSGPVTLRVATEAGCDDGGPRTQTVAFCTTSAATAAALPGDSVFLVAPDNFVVAGSGAPGKPITVYGDPQNSLLWGGKLTVAGQHDVVVKDMHLTSVAATGSAAITVDHVFLQSQQTGGVTGIHLSGTTGSTVTNSRVDTPGWGDETDTGILLDDGSADATISDTIVTGVQGTAVRVADSPRAHIVSDTVDTNSDGVVVEGASAGAVVANDILSNNTDTDLTVGADAVAQTNVGSNVVYSGGAAVKWDGTAYASVADFDAAGHGTADLAADPKFDNYDFDPEAASFFPGQSGQYMLANYGLAADSPAIDSADAAVPGQPATDELGAARVDDPDAANTGTGPVPHADRGAREFTGYAPTPWSATVRTGNLPGDYLTASVALSGRFTWSDPANAVYDFGDHTTATTSPAHTYSAAGTYQGTVSVTGRGGEKTTVPFTATPHTVPVTPAVTLTAAGGRSVVVSVADVPEGTLCDVDFGDGYSVKGRNCLGVQQYEYASYGTHTVTVTTNYNGWTGSASKQITLTDPTPPPPPAAPVVHRVWGADRYQTAVAASQQRFAPGSANAVVLARGDQFPDALAGGPLAAHVKAPLLLTDPHALTDATATEIDRVLGGDHSKPVYILGGAVAVSPAVEQAVTRLGYRVVRYGGADRYATALQIAEQGIGDQATVVVARGDEFPDALAAGPLAADRDAVLVLSDGARLDEATSAFVQRHGDVIAVGGPARTAVTTQIPLAGKTFQAAAGWDRYATAAQTAGLFTGGSHTLLGLATGLNFPDALAGGALMAAQGQPLLLTDPAALSADAISVLTRTGGVNIDVFGGPVAVSDAVVNQVAGIVRGRIG
ncbi:MAG: hypothetical protein HOW97_35875 [Catenulispora sp.]|nr:hypothetical protein [Catenulispora sp.]